MSDNGFEIGVGNTAMEKPPGTELLTCTVTPLAAANHCPTVSAVFVSRLRGGISFCAIPSGSVV